MNTPNDFSHLAASAYLEQAGDIIAKGWTQANDAVNGRGDVVPHWAPEVVAVCLRGAMLRTGAKDSVYLQAWRALASVCGDEPISYNDKDGRRQAQVVDACRKAAKLVAIGPIEATPVPPGSCPCESCRAGAAQASGGELVAYTEGALVMLVPVAPRALRAVQGVRPREAKKAAAAWDAQIKAELAAIRAEAVKVLQAKVAAGDTTYKVAKPFDWSKLLYVPSSAAAEAVKAAKALEPA